LQGQNRDGWIGNGRCAPLWGRQDERGGGLIANQANGRGTEEVDEREVAVREWRLAVDLEDCPVHPAAGNGLVLSHCYVEHAGVGRSAWSFRRVDLRVAEATAVFEKKIGSILRGEGHVLIGGFRDRVPYARVLGSIGVGKKLRLEEIEQLRAVGSVGGGRVEGEKLRVCGERSGFADASDEANAGRVRRSEGGQ